METVIIDGWIAGLIIGMVIILYFVLIGSNVGCSTGYKDGLKILQKISIKKHLQNYKFWFLIGVFVSGFLAQLISYLMNKDFVAYSFNMGIYDQVLPEEFILKVLWLIFAGVLLGFGARLAGGCMMGHGLVGVSMIGKYSILASVCFFISGLITTLILF